jgi:hypothetical protein
MPPGSAIRKAMTEWSSEPGMSVAERTARGEHFEEHDKGGSIEIVTPIAIPFLMGGALFRSFRQTKFDPAGTCPICLSSGRRRPGESDHEARRRRFLGD